jgi:hypothetical protein
MYSRIHTTYIHRRNGRCTALSIHDMDYHHNTGANIYTPQKSPLISSSMSQCVQLSTTTSQPDGSPLLCSDDYRSDLDDEEGEVSPATPMTSSTESVEHHFYERPLHYAPPPKHNTIHYNIPPPRPPPPPTLGGPVYQEVNSRPHTGTGQRLRHYSYSQSRDNFDYDYDYQLR